MKPTERREHYSIERCPGLQLDVLPSGVKTWRAYARNPSGKRVWRTIGPAHAITVGRAGDEARKFIEAATLGELAPKLAAPSRPTFADLFERWHAYTREHKRERSRAEDRRLFEKNINRHLGHLELGFKPEDRQPVIAALDAIAKEFSPIQANRAQAVISAAFSFALDEGLILMHPAARIRKRGAEQSRARDLSPAEIKAIWHGADAMDPSQRAVVRLLMLTGQRRSEIINIERRELDMDVGTLTVRAERRKAWRIGEAKHPHIVPFAEGSAGIIRAAIDNARQSVYLFPKRTLAVDAPMSPDNVTARFAEMMRRLKIDDCRLHDLRHMAKTGMTSLGVPSDIADRVQDQATGRGSGRIYDRYQYLAEKRRALELWERRLLEIVEAHAPAGERW